MSQSQQPQQPKRPAVEPSPPANVIARLIQARRSTPLWANRAPPSRPSERDPYLLLADELTPERAEKLWGEGLLKLDQLVDLALAKAAWLHDGLLIALGVTGWQQELRAAAQVIATGYDRYLDAYDSLDSVDGSFLDGAYLKTIPHVVTTPALHGRVRIHRDRPDFGIDGPRFAFVLFARGAVDPLLTVASRRFEHTVLVGSYPKLVEVAEAHNLRLRLLQHAGGYAAVRTE